MADELVHITGIEEVQELLVSAPRHIVGTAFLKAFEAADRVIEGELDLRTPEKSGELKAAKTHEITLDSNLRGGLLQIGFGKQGHKALWVEYGHRMVGHKPDKKELGTVEAHPFMRPAANASADRAIEAFADTLIETLKGEYE